MLRILLTSVFLFCFAFLCTAQDASFSQAYYNPLTLNPAFAGSTNHLRVNFLRRNQWTYVPGNFNSNFVSADFKATCNPLIGIGASAYSSSEGEGNLKTNFGAITTSLTIPLKPQVFDLSIGGSFKYVSQSVDWEKFTFSSQLDPVLGKLDNPVLPNGNTITNYTDISVGLLGSWIKRLPFVKTPAYINFGASLHHINRPKEAFFGLDSLPRRFVAHAGGIIPVGKNWAERGNSIFPHAVYQIQQGHREILLGMNFGFGTGDISNRGDKRIFLIMGTYYHNGTLPLTVRNTNELGFVVGFQRPSATPVQLIASYDVPLTSLTTAWTGSWEVSLAVYFMQNKFNCGSRGRGYGASPKNTGGCFSQKMQGYTPYF